MRALLLMLAAAALAGCATTPISEVPRHLFADARFSPPPVPVGADNLFELDAHMRRFADAQVAAEVERKGTYFGLFETLRGELRLDYDAPGTRPAADTFRLRTGNCLSLVVLTAAFAKHLDVPVYFQAVQGRDTWSRAGGIAFYSGHVNLRLGMQESKTQLVRAFDGLTIDFLAPDNAGRFSSHPIHEQTLIAMYLNNRGAEALLDGKFDEAYAWVRAAIEQDPGYLSSVNTLGVIYLRHGDLREAERAFDHVLRREPANANAMTNMVHVLTRAGRTLEATAWRGRLAALMPYPPFYFLDEGLEALARGDPGQALALFEQELERMPYNEELHFAIARADLLRGEVDRARKHLTLAHKYSTASERRNIYSAKLATLRALDSR